MNHMVTLNAMKKAPSEDEATHGNTKNLSVL